MEIKKQLKQVTIYTDGACSGNPGPGGYAAILTYNGHTKEISGGFKNTTNNRMEIMGLIKSLELLKMPCDITLHSDSKYLIDSIEKGWAKKWKANGWMRNKTSPALNSDLWEKVLALTSVHNIKFKWVKGHSGNQLNERCDFLAVEAAKKTDNPLDQR